MATYEELTKMLDDYNPQQQQLGVNFNAPEQEETPYQRMMRETYGSPAQMQGQEQQGDVGLFESIARNAASGFISPIAGQSDFVSGMMGSDGAIGKTLADKASELSTKTKEYGWRDIVSHPVDYALDVRNGLPADAANFFGSSASMLAEGALISAAVPASVGAAVSGGALALASKLGVKALPKALQILGVGVDNAGKTFLQKGLIANILSSPVEGVSEGGQTWRSMMFNPDGTPKKDADLDAAREAMFKDAAINTLLLTATNSMESTGLGNIFANVGGKSRFVQALKGLLWEGIQNGYEEGAQQTAQEYSMGQKQNLSDVFLPNTWSEDALNQAAVGAAGGLVLGGISGGGLSRSKAADPQQQGGENPAVNIQNAVTNNEFADAVAIAKHDTSTNLVDRMRNLEGRIGYKASDGTNCARTIGLAMAGTDYQDLINVDEFIDVAKNKGQLQDPNNYVPKPGDLAVVNDGNHIVMVSENGGTIQNGSSANGVYESAQSPQQMFGSVKYYISTSDMSSGDSQVEARINEESAEDQVAKARQDVVSNVDEVLGKKSPRQIEEEKKEAENQEAVDSYQEANAPEVAPINSYQDAFTQEELAGMDESQRNALQSQLQILTNDNPSITPLQKREALRGYYQELISPAPKEALDSLQQHTPQNQDVAKNATTTTPTVPTTANATADATEKANPVAQQQQTQQKVAQENTTDEATSLTGYQPTNEQRTTAKSDLEQQSAEQQNIVPREVVNVAKRARMGVKSAVKAMEESNLPEDLKQRAYAKADEEIAAESSQSPQQRLESLLKDDFNAKTSALNTSEKAPLIEQVRKARDRGLQLIAEGKTADEAFNEVKGDVVQPVKLSGKKFENRVNQLIADGKTPAEAYAEASKVVYPEPKAKKEGKKNGKSEKSEKLSQPKTSENRNPDSNTESEKVEQQKGQTGESGQNQNQAKVTDEKNSRINDALEMARGLGGLKVSTLQRRFNIGYNEASSMLEEMQDAGLISKEKDKDGLYGLLSKKGEEKNDGSNESGVSGVSETEQAGTVSADAEGRETGTVPGPADGTSEKVSQPNDEAVRNRASEPRPARTRRLSGKSENVGGKTDEQATLWGRISRTVRAFANSIHQLCADHEDDKVALDDLREEVEDILDKIDKEIGKADKTTAQQDYDNYFKYITVNVGGKEYRAELFTGPKGQDAIRWVTNAGSLADRGSKRSLGILMWHALTSRDANGNYPTLDKVISSIEKYYKKNKDAQIPQAYQDAIDYGKQLKKQKKDLIVTDNRPDNTTKYSAQQEKAQVKEQNAEQEEQKRSLDDLITEAKRAFKGATKFRINRENLIFTMPNGLELIVNPREEIILNASDEAKARKEHGLDEGKIVVEGYAKRLDKGSLIALSKESREGTTFHEAFHTIWDWVLTDKEKAAMLKHFTPIAKEKGIDVEEAMADGYRDWLLARRQHKGTMFGKLFQKIKDFANAALRVLTGTDNVDDIYRQIEEGKVWNRDANGRFATEENANTYTAEDGTRFSVNADVNPDAPIKIVDLTKKVPKSMQNNASVMNFITALAKNGTTFTDSEQKAVVSVLPKDIKHVTYSSKPIKYPMERKAHTSGIYGIKNVIKDSVLIESIPNKKTGSKPDVIAYHRFYTPVQIGNRIYAIRSVAEEHNNGVLTLNPTEVNLYDVIVERSRPVGSYTSYAVAADGSATISIRDMLTNVKDYYGKTYFSARKASQPNTKYSVRLASGKEVTSADFPSDFSTSKPGGEEAITDPQMELTFADYKSAQKDKDFFDKVIEKTKQVVGLDVPAKDSKEAAEQMIERMVENIRFLLNKVPEEYRDRAKRWYEGGNKIAKTWAERYGLPKQATAGIIAVLSPQMDWFTNVTLAERVLDAVYGHANERWSNKMTAIAKQIVSTDNKEAKVNLPALKRAKGKTLKELIANGDYRAAAIWVRCYDQCYNDRGYRILTPEGGVGDYVKTDTDENATAAWGNYGPIEKAISIAANPSYANIFYQLGDKHKVRNFANNLNNPDSELFTTVDTHAVGVGLMQPVSSTKSNSVLQNFGTGSSSSKSVGMSGSYFLYYEAIRRVAEETGLKPREVQSITWEAIRSLFPPHMKFGSEAQKKILELWRQGDEEIKGLEDPNDKEKVKEILDKIRNQVYDIGTEQTGVLREFDWANTPFDATTNDTYKRSDVKIQKFDKRENGKGGSSFGIEAAPDPNNKELTELWEKVKKQNPQLAQQISDEVVENTIRKVFREFGLDFNPHTDLVPRLGGYLGATNPSYELVIENPNLLLPISKMLGKALNQDSVMLVSSQDALGTTPHDIVSISLPDGWGDAEIDEFYQKLYEVKGPKDEDGNPVDLFTGHSTSNGVMTIVNTDDLPVELLLNGIKSVAPNISVETSNGYCGFVSKDEYGFVDENEKEQKPEEVVRVQIPKGWSKKQANALAKKIGGLKNKKGAALASSTSIAKGLMTIERADKIGMKSLLDAVKAIAPDLTVTLVNKVAGLNTEFVPKKTDDRRANLIQREATEELESKLLAATGSDLQEDGSGLDERKGRGDERRNLKEDGGVQEEVPGKAGNQARKVTTEQTKESTQGDEGSSSMPENQKYSITSTLGKAIDKAESYTNRNVREPNQQTATGRAARAFNNTQNKNNAQTFTEWLKDRFTKFYREWFDKNDALHDVDDAIEKVTGKKLAEADKIYNQAQGARSYAQGAAQTLVQGTKEAFKSLKDSLERGIDPKDTAAMDRLKELKKDFNYATMQQVLEPIMTKDMDRKYPDYLEKNGLNNWHDAFSNYLGARRILELVRLVEDKSLQYITHDKKQFTDFIDRHPEYEKFRPQPFAKGSWRDQVQKMAQADPDLAEKMAKDLAKEYKFPKGVSRADLEAMVAEAPKEFGTSADIYYQLQRNLLTMMELGHLIPADVHDKINKMYKDYCPLMIDYSDTAGLETAIAQFGRGADSIANVDSMLKHVLQLGSERGLISPLESTYKSIQALTNRSERNKVAVHLVKTVANSPELRKSGILTEVDGKASPDAKNCIFTVMINGKKVAFQTTQDLYGPIVGYDMPAAGIVEGFCRSAAQALRYGATTSPSFIIRNFIRDTIFAGISSRNGFVPVVDSMKGLLAYWHNKELRGEFDAMGITAYNYFGSGKNAVKSMEELMGEKDWQYLKEHPTQLIKELVKSVPKFIEFASESIEASTRMGEYMRARKNGKSMQEAALDARDVTLDFSRSGFYGQRVNMMVPFFNACLQGGDKMFNRMLFSKDPKVRMQTARMVGLYIMLPSMILWAMHKDEPWYEELDPHIKMNNWIIGKFRIPKPQEAGIAFGSGIEAMLDKIYDKDPKAGKEWRAALLDTMLPNLIPTVGLPMLEWITNYSIFRDKAIEGNRLKRLPVEMRYNTGTTEISKALSKAVGGAYGASPVKLDNTIRGYTGTLGMLVAQIPDAFFESRQNLPSKNVTERMMVRDFFINDMNLNRTSEDFYNLVNAAQQQHAGYGKKGKPTQDVKAINKALRDVSKQQKDIQTITDAKGISQDRKRQMIDKKRDIIKTIQKATLKRYGNKYDI